MKKLVSFVCFLLVITGFFLYSGKVFASSDEPLYLVQGVKVDTKAKSATLARDSAILTARKQAFDTLLNRIILSEEKKNIPDISDTVVANLVAEMAVMNEKTSSVRYIADLEFRFNDKAVKAFLEQNNIGYINTVSDNVLVLPVYSKGENVSLIAEGNDWLSFLQAQAFAPSCLPLVLPATDEQNIAYTKDLLQGVYPAFEMDRLKEKYSAKKLMIAEMQDDDKADTIYFSLYEPSSESFIKDSFDFSVSKNSSYDKIKQAAIDTIHKHLEDQWKKDNVVYFSSATVVKADIPITSLTDWVTIKDKLDKVAIIDKYTLTTMASDLIRVQIHFGRSPERLVEELDRVGLVLLKNVDSSWILYDKANKPFALISVVESTAGTQGLSAAEGANPASLSDQNKYDNYILNPATGIHYNE